jgi:predicted Fe-S protein YdhL (DUF1289 family)
MKRPGFSAFGFGLALLLSVRGFAAAPNAPPPLPAAPPPLPSPRSPVDFFRELLAMSGTERSAALSNRPPEIRARLLAKVREYELMPVDLRELRLRATDLRYYLLPLMRLPPAQRPALAVTVPPESRKLVADRLQQWDLLPPDAQRELLENELALDYFTQAQTPDPAQQRRLLESLPAAQRERLEADIARWQAMPGDERQRLFERVKKFFDLTAQEQEKALRTLSSAERRQMEQTQEMFEKLPREQRVQCIRSFWKFAGMSAVERLEFLKSAARWSAMSPGERQAWRELVRKLPDMPPPPPGFGSDPPPPLPPVPSGRVPAMATNGG